jgi:uncharacterized membrane protein
MRVEESIQINRPLEEVFDYTANPENLPEWTGPVIEVCDVRKSSSGQLQEGDTFTVVAKFLGRRFESPQEVSAYEPNRRVSFRSTGGPFPQQFIHAVEEVAGGCALRKPLRASRAAASGW